MVAIGDHYRPRETDHEDGIYRVVGVADDAALLLVVDRDGRRVHSGRVRHVPVETVETGFTETEDPDAGFALVPAVRNALSGLYWTLRP